MEGRPIYRTLTEVPGPVDHVVVSIPARFTPALMQECAAKGVKVVHMFSSGFADTGEPDRIELQNELVQIARRGNIRVIGPNCLGIYYPKGKIGLSPDFPSDSGTIGFLCQSGGNTDFTVRLAATRGLSFSKVVSHGNACDINECDLIDYFAADPETEVIDAYIEGVSDGPRFIQVLKKAASVKPVVIYKGGYTEGGLRAAASHTGSLAGTDAVWEGVVRQAGAIVQMPPGIPVATMAIGKSGARNAGIFAAQMPAAGDSDLAGRIDRFKKDMAAEVERKAEKLKDYR